MDPDHHQQLITSRGSLHIAHSCQVWSTSVSAFVSYPVYRMMDKNNHINSALSAEVYTTVITIIIVFAFVRQRYIVVVVSGMQLTIA